MPNTKRCTPATRAGRLAKARQFHLAADTVTTLIDDEEIADAYVTLCVHAGIAAADVKPSDEGVLGQPLNVGSGGRGAEDVQDGGAQLVVGDVLVRQDLAGDTVVDPA